MSFSKDDFYIGQRVRVRDWDDMMMEYGGGSGAIDTPIYCFVTEMRPLCGKTAQIFDILPTEGREGRKAHSVLLEKWEDDDGPTDTLVLTGHGTSWLFSTGMLSPVEEILVGEMAVSFDENAFNRMLGVNNV